MEKKNNNAEIDFNEIRKTGQNVVVVIRERLNHNQLVPLFQRH